MIRAGLPTARLPAGTSWVTTLPAQARDPICRPRGMDAVLNCHCERSEAISQIKAGSRRKKIELVNGCNPEWRDLYDGLFELTSEAA